MTARWIATIVLLATVPLHAAPAVSAEGDDWLPEAVSAEGRAASIPVVPLPPAVYGSAASVGLILALRYSRHRRWLTLR